MSKRRKPNKFSAYFREMNPVRGALILSGGIALSWLSFGLAVSGVTRTNNAETALQFIGNDPIALASRADQIFTANPEAPARLVKTMALAAIREQAINPSALRVLGYYTDAQENPKEAERLILKSAEFSRREFGSQLWLIEASVRKNDVKQALVHYDYALRTRPDSHALLFPTLVSALDDESIRAALKPYIRGKNGWAAAFLNFANGNSQNLPALVDLMVSTGGLPDEEAAKPQELALLSRLVAERFFKEARHLYMQIPDASSARLVSSAFDKTDSEGGHGAIGWQVIDDPDAGGSFSGKAPNSQMELMVFANSSTTRELASKLLYLMPGPYKFRVELKSLNRGDGGFLRWEFRCLSTPNAAPTWSLDSISMRNQATFDVQEACPVQRLTLVASGGKGQTGLEATIKDVALVKS